MGQGFLEGGHRAPSCACSCYHRNRGPDMAISRCDSLLFSGLLARESVDSMAGCEEQPVADYFSARGGASNFFKAFIATQQRKGLRLLPCLAETAGGG